MAVLKKLVILIIVATVAYFGVQQFALASNLDKLAGIDAHYGLSEGQLAPADATAIPAYENELLKLSSGFLISDNVKRIIAVKIELAEMQKNMLALSRDVKKIDFTQPDCSVAGPIAIARKDANDALSHAQTAIQKRATIQGAESFKSITSQDFETTMKAVTDALNNSIASLGSVCQ